MKIFIIDDEQVSLFVIQQKLMVEGVAEEKELYTFQSAKEALAVLAQCSPPEWPDVLLLDLNMPEMNGWQFLDALANSPLKLHERSRIYILTSSLALSDEERANGYPMIAGFMHKPLSTENVRKIVAREPTQSNDAVGEGQ